MRRIFTSYLPSIALGAFLARFFYELDPLRLAFLGDWPGVIALVAVCLLIAYYMLRVTHYAPRITLIPLWLLFVYIFWPDVDLRWALVLLIGSLVLVGQVCHLLLNPMVRSSPDGQCIDVVRADVGHACGPRRYV